MTIPITKTAYKGSFFYKLVVEELNLWDGRMAKVI